MRSSSDTGLRARAGSFLWIVVLAAVSGLVPGCQNSVAPIGDEARLSLYGALSLSSDNQYVRVRDLQKPLTPAATRQLNVQVTLERLRDGQRFSMRDSVVSFDSVYTHNFYRRLALEPEAAYRVIATHADGRRTTATARMPPILEEVATPDSANCQTPFRVTFTPVTDLRTMDITVVYQHAGDDVRVEYGPRTTDLLSFRRQDNESVVVEFTPETLLSYTIPSQDESTRFLYEPRCLVLDDDRIEIEYLQYGPEWQADGAPAEPFDPTETSPVTDGLGFLGGIRRDSTFIEVDTANAIPIDPTLRKSAPTPPPPRR
jgi:hypothetical protein